MFPSKLAFRIPNNISKNPLFCSFVSFSIVLVIPFHEMLESSKIWAVFVMPIVSSFEIIEDFVRESCIFF